MAFVPRIRGGVLLSQQKTPVMDAVIITTNDISRSYNILLEPTMHTLQRYNEAVKIISLHENRTTGEIKKDFHRRPNAITTCTAHKAPNEEDIPPGIPKRAYIEEINTNNPLTILFPEWVVDKYVNMKNSNL